MYTRSLGRVKEAPYRARAAPAAAHNINLSGLVISLRVDPHLKFRKQREILLLNADPAHLR